MVKANGYGLIDCGLESSLAIFFFIFLSQKEQKIEWKYDEGGVEFCQLSSKSQPTFVWMLILNIFSPQKLLIRDPIFFSVKFV